MNKRQIAHFEKRLQEERARAMKELGHYGESFNSTLQASNGDLSSYSFHMADQGSDTMERELAFTLASREGRYLHHLNEALERIENGTYGKCRTCGGEIGKTRLEAVPHATQCIKCKNFEEKKQRGL